MDILEIQEKVTGKKDKEEWIEWLDTNLPGVSRERKSNGNIYIGFREKSDRAEVVTTTTTSGYRPFGS